MSILLSNTHPTQYVSFMHNGVPKRLYGGSFFMAPDNTEQNPNHDPNHDQWYTINLMAEYALPCSHHLPIVDFGVPANAQDLINVFEEILQSDKKIYVGCFGGIGRTGLFMGCLLQYLGCDDPVREVRAQYNEKAVETPTQMDFVHHFPRRSSRPRPTP